MKNISMFIRGAIGIKKGLGLDEIEFDLKDKVGLVALSGPNGKGKSTVLELMSLYRTLASRKGSLKHHFCLRDSRVEHKFIYDGDEYHLIWKIDSGSDRSEAFIIVNGESIVNGKTTEYDKYIHEKFGSKTLFYNSVFCAQGSSNLSTMTTGKIKELFVEFLRIERLAEYEKRCKQGLAYNQKKIDKLSGKIEACQNEIDGLGNNDFELIKNKSAIELEESEIEKADGDIKELDKKINLLKVKEEKQKTDIARKTELETELKKLEDDRNHIREKLSIEIDTFENKKSALEKELEPVDIILADKDKILNAASRIDNLKQWEKYFAECFECSMDEQVKLDQAMKTFDSKKEEFAEKIIELENDLVLDGLRTTLNYLTNQKFDFESNNSVLCGMLDGLLKDFSLMQASSAVKSCKEKIAIAIDPDCTSKICPALDMVSKAKEELPGLEEAEANIKAKVNESIKEVEASIKISNADLIDLESKTRHCLMDYDSVSKKITSEIIKLSKVKDSFNDKKNAVVSDYLYIDEFKGFYKWKLANTREWIAGLKELSSQKPQIEIAEEKKTSINGQIKQIESDYTYRENEIETDLYKAQKNILAKEEVIAEIDFDTDNKIDDKIFNTEGQKADTETKKAEIIKTLDHLKETAAVLKNNKARKKTLSKDLKSKQADVKIFKKELSEWEYLKLACSKTGLQALEIDGAAPLITAEANTLLDKAFGLESQIKIITQDPESGREVFWIKVIREDGSEDDFANLSGGQKVWISHALSLGMTLISKRKSGRNFDTLYMDESDGALDSEKAIDFIKLYRAMLDTGDFETCYFISHNPDLIAMADFEINFGALC